MGMIALTFSGRRWTASLGAVNTVGRHWSCTHRVDESRVPMFWLEIRYGPDGWVWRPLEGRGITRGGGAQRANGWRMLDSPSGRAVRVRCGDAGHISLLDSKSPSPFLSDLLSGLQLAGPSLLEVLERHDGGFFRLGEGDDPSRALVDGDIVVHRGSAWRFFSGTVPPSTDGGVVSLKSDTICLDLDLRKQVLCLTERDRSVELTDSLVILLVPFVEARIDEHRVEGGWLSLEEAHRGWVAAGGRADSPPERISWDKGRLRTRLAALGVGDVGFLFEKRRRGGVWQTRLRISGERLGFKDYDEHA